jgi:hypothetical protein
MEVGFTEQEQRTRQSRKKANLAFIAALDTSLLQWKDEDLNHVSSHIHLIHLQNENLPFKPWGQNH